MRPLLTFVNNIMSKKASFDIAVVYIDIYRDIYIVFLRSMC